MLLNVVRHVAARLYLGSYAPGFGTAVFLIFPATFYLLILAWRSRYVSSENRRKRREN